MKKSKQYAQEIIDQYILTDKETAIKGAGVAAIIGLCEEYEQIKKARNLVGKGGIGYNGILNVLKEQHLKWLSICRHVNKEVVLLNDDGWLMFVSNKMPGLYPNLMEIIQQKKKTN